MFISALPSLLIGTCLAQEQYPPPLVHTPANHPAAHVLLLTVNGLRAVDLANWVAAHPRSTLAELSAHGVTYTNAHTPLANEAAGLLALTTGGTPISTGIIASDGYDHALAPAGSRCETRGTELNLESIFEPGGKFDSAKAPRNPEKACVPLAPHDLLRVNTIFEVVREKIGDTAWAGESAGITDLLRGPSGKGVVLSVVPDGTTREADTTRVNTVLRWIEGKDRMGATVPVPALFGMSFASVAEGQWKDGYADAISTPSPGLTKALSFLDESIGRIVRGLKGAGLYDSTWIKVTAAYGQPPMDGSRSRIISLARMGAVVDSVGPGLVAHITGGGAAMIWLRDSTQSAIAAKVLAEHATELGVREIYFGARLALTLNPPSKDSRMPDIILEPEYGVRWMPPEGAVAAQGGMSDEDTHVALLISGRQLAGRRDPTYVPTTQLAPLLLRALGMEKFDLEALHKEHSPALPGIF